MAETPQNTSKDSKPIDRNRLSRLLKPSTKKEISVQKPTLESVSATGGVGKPRPPKPIAIETRASTYVKPTILPEVDRLKEQKFVNTINAIGKNAGIGEFKKSSPIYESVRQVLINKKDNGGLVTINDENGNPIYASASTIGEDFSKGWDDHHLWYQKGKDYIFQDRKKVIALLNDAVTKKPVLEIPKEPTGLSYLGGRMAKPLLKAIPGVVAGSPQLIFALSAPDAIAIKYAESLEENYKRGLDQGMTPDQAYESSKNTAIFAAGGEGVMQALFAKIQTPSKTKDIFEEGTKKAVSTTLSTFLNRTGNFIKTPTILGAAGATTQLATDVVAESQGIKVEDKMSRAIENGSSLFLLDFGLKSLIGVIKAPGYLKASFANAFEKADKQTVKAIVKEGEDAGIYQKGTLNKLNRAVDDFAKTKEQSPDFGGDHVRTQVVTGLTQKLNSLLEKQSKLADIHKADLDAEISQLKERIAYAKNAENPLMAELADDGTPLVSPKEQTIDKLKTQEDATKTSKEQVQESVPSSSVGEYQRAKAVEEQATNEADNRNSLVGGKEEKVTPAQMAEAEMQGLKTEDSTELMKIAKRAIVNKEAEDMTGVAKIMRQEMESKIDMTNISDESLVKLAELAKGMKKIEAGPAKRIKMPEEVYFKQEILTNPKEAFKAMYTAAKKANNSMAERLKMAAEAIAEARKDKGLDIDVNRVQTSISKFVTEKMDTETAAESFADNLDDIIRDAENAKTNTANKGLITDIKKAAKSKTYGTVATRETTQGIDFISPHKVENPIEYNKLLGDYKKSITGEIPETENVRQKLIDYINSEKEKYEAAQITKYEKKYDKLVADGKPPMTEGDNPRVISRDEWVEVQRNPVSAKVDDLAKYEYKVSESKADVMKEMTDVRQSMLKESIDKGQIDDDLIDVADEISKMDVNKIQPKNIKLFNNIIEDVMNGEKPSRLGEIRSDIEVVDKLEILSNKIKSFRNIKEVENYGLVTKLYNKIFNKPGYEYNYKKLNIFNKLNVITNNDKDFSTARSVIFGDFEEQNNIAINIHKQLYYDFHEIFLGKKVETGGVVKEFSTTHFFPNSLTTTPTIKITSPVLNDLNSYRLGIVSALMQFEDINTNINIIGDIIKRKTQIAEINKDGFQLKKTKIEIEALQSLGVIEDITYSPSGKSIESITFKQDINIGDIMSKLNDRESFAINYTINSFKNIVEKTDESLRQNFGESLDMSNNKYLPLSAKLHDKVDVIDLENGDIYDRIPDQMRYMRAGTTMQRNKSLISKTMYEGKDVNVFYDFDFFHTMPQRYFETLQTAYTSGSVKTINKLSNNKQFHDIITNKLNLGEIGYEQNKKIIVQGIKNYVNLRRMPNILTESQKRQRSGLNKFVMGRLLNNYGQFFKQSTPALSYTMTEAGIVPFNKSNNLILGSLVDDGYRQVLFNFLRKTELTDRDLAGFEAYAKQVSNLDISDDFRNLKDAYGYIQKLSNIPMSTADTYTSMTSLLTGYIKGLKVHGVIENYDDIDLIELLQQPIDQNALAYAQNFHTRVNNSSNSAGRAEVLISKGSEYTRFLGSYNLNQWADFNINYSKWTDPSLSAMDRSEAANRMKQYFFSQALYGATRLGIGYANMSMVKYLLEQSGIDLFKKGERSYKDTDLPLLLNGEEVALSVAVDAFTGGANTFTQMAIKAALYAGMEYGRKAGIKKAEKTGAVIEGTRLSKEYTPIYKSDGVGIPGKVSQDIQDMVNLVTPKNEEEITPTKGNQKTINVLKAFQLGSYFLPTSDLTTGLRIARKEIEKHGMTQEELDGFMMENIDKPGWEDAREYIDNRRKEFKDNTWDIYYMNKVYPMMQKTRMEFLLKDATKAFGPVKSKEMLNVAKMTGKKLYTVMNNRYPTMDITADKELMTMVHWGAISPREYTESYLYNKDGDVDTTKVLVDGENMMELVTKLSDRYKLAAAIAPENPVYKYDQLPNVFKHKLELTPEEIAQMIIDAKVKIQKGRDIIR